MSRGINRVTIVGYMGADPETRYSANGTAVTKIRVATSEEWKNKQTGERESRTEWHRVTAFGRLAEIMGEYLKKGSQVYIEGKLHTSSYEKEGQTHYSTDIIANEMQMLGSRSGGQQQGGGQQQSQQGSGGPANDQTPSDDFDDDIPFISMRGIW